MTLPSPRSRSRALPHEIRIACGTDTLELFTLAKVFLVDDSQNRVGTMLTRMRIEEGPDVR